MKKTLAAIDVGSNSVRLMIAEVDGASITPVERGLITTRLIAGMENNLLTEAAIKRTADAIVTFAEQARSRGVEQIHVFGTSAMRDAANSSRVSDLTEARCGLRVRIIAGEEEARLAYAGTAPNGRCGVIDIGGGSTEMIVGEDGQVLTAHSAPIGIVRLKDRLNDRLEPDEMIETALTVIAPKVELVKACPAERWIGVGGSITTLAAMDKKLAAYSPEAIENHPLTPDGVEKWLDALCDMTLEERLTLAGLPARRADVIPYGIAILAAVMRALNISAVHASDHDNLEGYIRRHML